MEGKFAALAGDRVGSRLKQLGRLIGCSSRVVTS
jgi:hypothetical protein